MRNDSIETLLLRHYGSTAPAPENLEQRLSASVYREARAEQATHHWGERQVSRRRVLQLITFSGAGAVALGVGINVLHDTLVPQRSSEPAYAL